MYPFVWVLLGVGAVAVMAVGAKVTVEIALIEAGRDEERRAGHA